ncbi:MAG TPA: PP2C family serine/threonine-protein phosphatase [Armatimonadota bacterium]|jgi:protein phosphatase
MQEITAELNPQDLATPEPAPREGPPRMLPLTFAAKTDMGRIRENNEDKFDFWEPEDPALLANRGRLYAVADGMGGHAAGQIAAEMALKAVGAAYFARTAGLPADALSRAIAQANAQVFETARAIPSRAGMGCTIVAVAIVDEQAIVAWAGDSRVYLVREGAASRVTQDHSWVAEQVALGMITEEQAERSSYRNVITRSLGPQAGVTPDVVTLDLLPGDALLLCSDGLTTVVKDAELPPALAGVPPSFACQALIEIANDRGGPDNITAAILRVSAPSDAAPTVDPPRRRKGLFGR